VVQATVGHVRAIDRRDQERVRAADGGGYFSAMKRHAIRCVI
jgi:hypothetical protein